MNAFTPAEGDRIRGSRIDTARTIRAPRGNTLTCKSWLTEAPFRMIQNNLDPEVAENPHELVVYGGIGRAARNWECFDAILRSLRDLNDDPGAVLDPQLRVRGVQGLRVADASAMPFLPAINPNITTMMIGEKGADLVRGREPQRRSRRCSVPRHS